MRSMFVWVIIIIIIIIIIIYLFNDALNPFYLRLYGKGPLGDRGNPLLPHGLLFQNSSNGSFICIITQT